MNEPSQNGKSSEEEAASWFDASAKTRMSLQRFKGPMPLITLLLATFPVPWIFALHFYALEASVYLGHWPSYENPDPKQLGGLMQWQYPALAFGLVSVPWASVMSIVLAIVGRIESRDFPIWTAIVTAIVSFALFVGFGVYDPGGLGTWFMD